MFLSVRNEAGLSAPAHADVAPAHLSSDTFTGGSAQAMQRSTLATRRLVQTVDNGDMTTNEAAIDATIQRLGGLPVGEPPASFRVSAIESTDGNTIEIPPSGVTVVVGPNNAGKSTLLREIHTSLTSEPSVTPITRVVRSVETNSTGGAPQVLAWLAQRHPLSEGNDPTFTSSTTDRTIGLSWAESFLPMMLDRMHNTGRFGSQLGPFVSLFLASTQRMQITESTPIRRFRSDPATHPVHALEDDSAVLDSVQRTARDVFGIDLTLDVLSAERRLKVGAPVGPAPVVTDDLTAYSAEVNALPDLSQQGDGMRSFFGIMLTVLSSQHPILLIDEPEAFLHPPQAKALGRLLGEIATTRGLQIFVATHDRGLVSGLLDSSSELTIVRLQRTTNKADMAQIGSDDLKQVWSQPAIRFSNALDGLFHHAVVLVESEHDAQFYAAALTSALTDRPSDRTSGDMLFIPCGGKGGLAKVAREMTTLGIPTVAVADIDLLRDAAQTAQLVKALGGQWEPLRVDFEKATSRIDDAKDTLTVGDLKRKLGSDDAAVLDKRVQEDVRRYLKMASKGWQNIKDNGYKALGTGDVRLSALALLEGLDESGVVLVKEGELEAFAADLGITKGPTWFESAYKAGKHESAEAQALIERVISATRR